MLDLVLPYVAGLCILTLIVLRVIRSRKYGAGAVKFDVLFLAVYAFLAGVLFAFFINHSELGWMGPAIFTTFFIGFLFRAMPLFRLISKVEKEAAEKR